MTDLLDRIAAKFEVDENGCWTWIASRNPNGYGQIAVDQRQRGAHRVTYELVVEDIPGGHDIDHLCRNRACINPDHLEPVTRRENARRGLRGVLAPAECPSGHAFNEENAGLRGNGFRYCKQCNRDRVRRAKQKRRVRPVVEDGQAA